MSGTKNFKKNISDVVHKLPSGGLLTAIVAAILLAVILYLIILFLFI